MGCHSQSRAITRFPFQMNFNDLPIFAYVTIVRTSIMESRIRNTFSDFGD